MLALEDLSQQRQYFLWSELCLKRPEMTNWASTGRWEDRVDAVELRCDRDCGGRYVAAIPPCLCTAVMATTLPKRAH